jgi:two-component system chemotaxis response regulator CheY
MSRRVLVADDDADMRQVLVYALAAVGVDNVVEARRGDEAVGLIFEEEFDLLVLDWYMPGLDGMEIVRAIRAVGRETPVIMVTGEKHHDLVVEAIRGGVSDYLIKPFDHESLLAKLSKYCGQPVEPC